MDLSSCLLNKKVFTNVAKGLESSEESKFILLSEARKENKQDGESDVGHSSLPIIFKLAVWLNPGPDPLGLELLSGLSPFFLAPSGDRLI